MLAAWFLILAAVTAERIAELAWARRNTAALIRQGAKEVGAGHYPLIVLLHAFWLAGRWISAPGRPVNWAFLVLFGLLQLARLWVLWTLGRRWTTRIIVLPGEPLVARGPFRFMRHPNYAVVMLEIAVLPLVFSMPLYALLFFVLNGALLWVRVRAEDAALRGGSPGN